MHHKILSKYILHSSIDTLSKITLKSQLTFYATQIQTNHKHTKKNIPTKHSQNTSEQSHTTFMKHHLGNKPPTTQI